MSWQAQAACADTDPRVFFPGNGQSAESAKAICRRCPVRRECGDAAIDRGEQHGVWGGMSVDELEAARRDPATGKLRRKCEDCTDWATGNSPHCDTHRRERRAMVVARYDKKRRDTDHKARVFV